MNQGSLKNKLNIKQSIITFFCLKYFFVNYFKIKNNVNHLISNKMNPLQYNCNIHKTDIN